MKIDLSSIDLTQFMVHPQVVDGQVLHLVQPQHIGTKFTQQNKIFRSSVWDNDGNLVSAGLPKFTNFGENPENFPVPASLKDTTVVEKIDGSLLIVSKWNGKYILRTRGTVDAHKLDNGHELALFERDILPKLHDDGDMWACSFLFEWVSPTQRIILNYGDSPDWFLVGCVSHWDYSLNSQEHLNKLAAEKGFKRPTVYTFPSVEDLMKNVELWRGKEGVVIYSDHDQMLHKAKSGWYLALHRMKEALASIDKVIDVWFEQGRPSFQNMKTFVTNQFDWELWVQVQGDVSRICDAWKEVENIVRGIDVFVNDTLRPMTTRRDQALRVLSSYGNTNRAAFVFKRLDNKPLADDDLKKLLYQVMKK